MDNFDKTGISSFLRKLLVEPGYRMTRHLLFITILVIISLNQTFMTMREGIGILGSKLFLQFLFLLAGYTIVCYFNLYVLLPKYLLVKQYMKYFAYLVLTVSLLITIQTSEELTVLTSIDRIDDFYTPPMIFVNMLSSFILVILCITGGVMTVVLKHWMINGRKVGQLERLHIQSEVEQLKEQVNPHLLFNILNRTGVLAKYQREEASDMLIRLSQLLRYQLYDCNREKVLLSAEIKFLRDYLTLEQKYSGAFTFTIASDKSSFPVLVSPLLFITFVQSAVIRIYERQKQASIQAKFEVRDDFILFTCHCDLESVFSGTDFSKINRRLELLYKHSYSLAMTNNVVTLKVGI